MNSMAAVRMLLAAAALLLCTPLSAGADIYTWIGVDGVHYFSDERPVKPGVEERIFIRARPYERPDAPVHSAAEPPVEARDRLLTHNESPPADDAAINGLSSPIETSPPEYASSQIQDAPLSPEHAQTRTVSQSRHPATTDHRVIVKYRHQRSPSYREHQWRLRHRFYGTRGTRNYHRKFRRESRHQRRPYPGPNVFPHGDHRRPHGDISGGPEGRHSIRKPDRPRVRHRFLPMLPPDGQRLNRHRHRTNAPPGRRR
jgi:hypothetical protein